MTQRGTEYIVVAVRVASVAQREALVARLPMTGDELSFPLDEIATFQVIDS